MSNAKILRRCYNFVEAEACERDWTLPVFSSVIDGAETQLMLSYVGTALGGVKVEVAPEDYDRAVALLEDDESKAAIAGPWVCDRCREQNDATFELCWQCQKPRDDHDHRADAADTTEPAAADPNSNSGPTRAP